VPKSTIISGNRPRHININQFQGIGPSPFSIKMNFRKTSYQSYSKRHSKVTKDTYDKFALEYANMWEWDKKTQEAIMKYNIIPFSKFCKQGGKVLVA